MSRMMVGGHIQETVYVREGGWAGGGDGIGRGDTEAGEEGAGMGLCVPGVGGLNEVSAG